MRDPAVVQRAHEVLADLIEEIVLTPDPAAQDGYQIELRGDFVGILGAYTGAPKDKLPNAVKLSGSQLSVVAGARFELTTFRL